MFFEDISKSEELLKVLNNKHPNIKFTEEREKVIDNTKSEIPFLDVLVTRDTEKGLQTSVYRKKTFTGTYLHWNSLAPRDYKIGLINCLLDRAHRIWSTEESLKNEIKKLKQILSKNEYPPKIVSNTIKKFQELKKRGPKTKIDTSYDVPKKKVILVLPYYRGADEIKKREQELRAEIFSSSRLSICFQISFNDR